MKIKCNNVRYEIIEKEQLDNKEDVGYTDYQNRQIILKKLDKDFMVKTLKHELTHVWLYEYGHNQDEKEFNNEDVCEIVASSNDFINEAIEQYIQHKQVCHVENKKWEDLSDYEKELILKGIKESPIKILQE